MSRSLKILSQILTGKPKEFADKWILTKSENSPCLYMIIYNMYLGLERVPLSLVSTIVELLERKKLRLRLENREYGRRDPSRKSWHYLYRQAAVVRSVYFTLWLRPRSLFYHIYLCKATNSSNKFLLKVNVKCIFIRNVNLLPDYSRIVSHGKVVKKLIFLTVCVSTLWFYLCLNPLQI
jgi:hypothetical protein